MLTDHLANLLPRFETIYVLSNGLITHQAGYSELLAEGLVVEETMADLEAPVSAPDSDKGAEVSHDPAGEVDEEEKNKQAPSDWSVYLYFFRSCGLLGIILFFVLAAALAAERSFESKSSPCLLHLRANPSDSSTDVWLKMWAESTTHGLTFYITIFTGLIIGGILLLYALCLCVSLAPFCSHVG